jgi:hypothetical protein
MVMFTNKLVLSSCVWLLLKIEIEMQLWILQLWIPISLLYFFHRSVAKFTNVKKSHCRVMFQLSKQLMCSKFELQTINESGKCNDVTNCAVPPPKSSRNYVLDLYWPLQLQHHQLDGAKSDSLDHDGQIDKFEACYLIQIVSDIKHNLTSFFVVTWSDFMPAAKIILRLKLRNIKGKWLISDLPL